MNWEVWLLKQPTFFSSMQVLFVIISWMAAAFDKNFATSNYNLYCTRIIVTQQNLANMHGTSMKWQNIILQRKMKCFPDNECCR